MPNRLWIKLITTTVIIALVVLVNFAMNTRNTEASRSPGEFLNQDFWDSNPSDGNIIYALYGDGTPGSTPYNQNWTDGCIATDVEYINAIPGSLDPNTIYVLASGNYTQSNYIMPENCSTIIGKGDVKIKLNSSSIIFGIGIGNNNTIIDNIDIEGIGSGAGINLWSTINNTINNVEISGFLIGIYLNDTKYNTVYNVIIHNNNIGVSLLLAKYNYLYNIQSYNNILSGGIYLDTSEYNIINNDHFFNNKIGIYIKGSGNNTINNSQIYNNDNGGIYIENSNNNIFNNSEIYDNNSAGITITSGHQTLNNLLFYNNTIPSSTRSYASVDVFGDIKSFGNNSDGVTSTRNTLLTPPNGLARNVASIYTGTEVLDYSWFTNSINSLGDSLLSGTTRSNLRGIQDWLSTELNKYVFGWKTIKQIKPVKYSGENLIAYGIEGFDRDTDKYIAEVNMEISPDDEAIINYYYGPDSEFTTNWDNNNCSIGAFTVEHINSIGDFSYKLLGNNSVGHTIYVLNNISNDLYEKINITDNCIAIIDEGSGTKLSLGGASLEEFILVEGKENIIFDNLILEGEIGSDYTNYGINLDSIGGLPSKNNTLNNIRSYNHEKNGIMLGIGSDHNTIMNSQVWSNGENGIEIYYAGNYNIINNSIAYNNSGYGIRFGNGSKYNTINNSQFFNNHIGGIFADFTTQQNIINNVHTYNNAGYGINFKRSSSNTLNDVYIYNNNIGINMTDVSCTSNTYNGDLVLFDNTGGNLIGTNGNDNFLDSANPNSSIVWYQGAMTPDNETMLCNWATNPRYTISSSEIWLLSGGNMCNDMGIQVIGSNRSTIDYLFGQSIKKQESPVGYSGTTIINISNQYNSGNYIGEVNPIMWTNPGNISFVYTSGNINLEPHTNYEIDVQYNSGFINYNFDVQLNLNQNATGYIIVSTGNARVNVGTGINNLPFDSTNIKLIITTTYDYNSIISGELYIGTAQYGSNTGVFSLKTKYDPIPPTILWIDNISTSGILASNNTWQAIITGMYNVSSWYQYVTGAIDCNSDLINSGFGYTGDTITIPVSEFNNLDGQYVCIYAQDNTNGYTSTGISNQIQLSSTPPFIDWTNNISTGGLGGSNTWQAAITGSYDVSAWYQYMTGTNYCDSGIVTNGNIYTGTIVDIVNDPQYSNLDDQYVCIYAKDNINGYYSTGISNQIKVSNLEFIDDINLGPVFYEIIDIDFNNLYNIGYRRVDTGSECSTSGLSGLILIEYTNPIILNSDSSFNDKYLCAYGEDSIGIGYYQLSANKVSINNYSSVINLVDDVSEERVTSDTISLYFSGGISFDQKKYKWVSNIIDCSNTTGMVDYTGDITLVNESFNDKYFCFYSHEQVSGIENYLLSTNPVMIDITPPTTANIISPTTGENVIFLTVKTTGAVDNEAGLSGLEYDIAESATFLDIVDHKVYYIYDGIDTYISGTNIDFIPDFDSDAGTYAIRIRSIDAVGNKSNRSNIVSFNYQPLINFEFGEEVDADPGEIYMSNEITISGLDTNETILASISSGVLYRNGDPKGTGTLVQNNDTLSIEMFASDNYDETVETELSIWNKKIGWTITTISEDYDTCELSNSQMLSIATIYNSIFSIYDDESKANSFLITMQSMLEDNIDLAEGDDNVCNLIYLLDKINDTLDNGNNPTNTHITPNCKEYTISYNQAKDGYYSPDMVIKTYFESKDDLGKYLDSKNPGDCHVNSYGEITIYNNIDPNRHVAPNGKVYTIELNEIGYLSPEFKTIKYFANLSNLRDYINRYNPAIAIWDHNVDSDFEPVTHTAPNHKTYKIYKTNRGYMSYKFLSVKYFNSYNEIIAYIDKYNK